MTDIQVGEYCRVDGNIAKLLNINEYENCATFDAPVKIPLKGVSKTITIYDMLRYTTNHSHNLIDLIEVGDYVNGLPIRFVENGRIDIGQEENYLWLKNEHIVSVVTKEQFKAMEYKVGGEDD